MDMRRTVEGIVWQQADPLAAGVRRDDLYVDHGVSGNRLSRQRETLLPPAVET
ncbi:hypothetical protein [Pseudarthrobacter sulfonivorans]|nr:hypothetical protein [Pseudarthrobacter sulfonivorans]